MKRGVFLPPFGELADPRLLADLDENGGYGFHTMYGVHGIDDNPQLHPYAEPDLLCESCGSNADCGGPGNMCVSIPDEGRHCAAACTTDAGCPDGYRCRKVASSSSQTIFGSMCVPDDLSCEMCHALGNTTNGNVSHTGGPATGGANPGGDTSGANQTAEIRFRDNGATWAQAAYNGSAVATYRFRTLYSNPYGATAPTPTYADGTASGADTVNGSILYTTTGSSCNSVISADAASRGAVNARPIATGRPSPSFFTEYRTVSSRSVMVVCMAVSSACVRVRDSFATLRNRARTPRGRARRRTGEAEARGSGRAKASHLARPAQPVHRCQPRPSCVSRRRNGR